jgi:outer membrane receptor protein involved in Fe transport
VLGLDGTLPEGLGPFSGWNWEAYYHYGRNTATTNNQGRFIRNRIGSALGPSFMDANGNVVCGTPGNVIDGCVPLNIFGGMGVDGQGTITQDMIDYIAFQGADKGYSTLEGASLRVGGMLAEIPFGGPVGLALGYDYREEFGGDLPNPLTAAGESTGPKAEPTEGGYFVNEGFAELSVTVLEGMPGAEVVEISGSVRAFDYSNYDADKLRDYLTWKAGLRWQILQDVAVRGTYSTGFRAPTIAQLFSGNYLSWPSTTDPCSGNPTGWTEQNCRTDGVPEGFYDPQSQLVETLGGNQDLLPETADIITGGLVFQPTFLEGLTFTVDYWNIEIADSIQAIGADVLLGLCYNADPATRDDAWCQEKIVRSASHNIINIWDTQENIGGVEAWGLDFQLRYDMKMDFGRFLWNFEGTYLGKYDEIQADGTVIPGQGVYDLEYVLPDWKFNVGLIYAWEDLGAGINARIVGGFKECEDNDCKNPVHDPGVDETNNNADDYLRWPFEKPVDAWVSLDLFVSYTLEWPLGTTRLTVGCNNLLNADPPRIYEGFNNTTDPAEYDVIGRFFYMRLGQTF